VMDVDNDVHILGDGIVDDFPDAGHPGSINGKGRVDVSVPRNRDADGRDARGFQPAIIARVVVG
jgi:hypothetical protein